MAMRMKIVQRTLERLYRQRDKIEMPEFQRGKIWKPKQKTGLLDSILKEWHLPKFYFRKLSDGTIECIDGQQRLQTVWDFYDEKISLANDTAEKFEGKKKYSDLPQIARDTFDDYQVDIEEIENSSETEASELYLRLQLGTPLNTSEKLNAISGKKKQFCRKIADHSFFTEKLWNKSGRGAHFEIVVRWLLIETDGIPLKTRHPQLQAFLKKKRAFSENKREAKTIKMALDYLAEAVKYRKPYLKKANVLTVCMLAARIVTQNLHKDTAEEFGSFLDKFFERLSKEVEKGTLSSEGELRDYQNAVSGASAEGYSIQRRIDILSARSAAFFPAFSKLLGAYKDTALDS